jgi:hypothetical protein
VKATGYGDRSLLIFLIPSASQHNIDVWTRAPDLATARPLLKRVIGSRLNDKYLQTKAASSSYRTSSDFPHKRSTATGIIAKDIYDASHATAASLATPPSPSLSDQQRGSRKVISSFSTFSASPGISFSSAGSPRMNDQQFSGNRSPPPAAFGTFTGSRNSFSMDAPRGGPQAALDDDDEDVDTPSKPLPVEISEDGGVEVKGEDGQRIALRQGVISMDQVRRLAMQSAYRSGLAN